MYDSQVGRAGPAVAGGDAAPRMPAAGPARPVQPQEMPRPVVPAAVRPGLPEPGAQMPRPESGVVRPPGAGDGLGAPARAAAPGK